tara:strand:+ start:236 stop:490 length:255 start_codon:yes stop_codon:yes gene_type:complete
MNQKVLMATIGKHTEFLDELEKDIKICVKEDEQDADKTTDGSGDILKGRVEMGREVLGRLENFRQYLTRDFYQVGNNTVYKTKE